MLSKRLNIMFYSNETGEQIILPINPENIELKYEKDFDTFDIIGFGKIYGMGNRSSLSIRLSHFLPEDDSVFNTNSGIMYKREENSDFIEYDYSCQKAVDIFRKWAFEKVILRVAIDDEINIECFISSFSETIRENTASKPYVLEIKEYRTPFAPSDNSFGLYGRKSTHKTPKVIVMKRNDTVYSVADKYGLDYKTLAKNNNIKDANAQIPGTILYTSGA